MFKISTIDTQTERRLVVEGTLIQPWDAELRTTWGTANEKLDGRKLVIDLSNATVISREAEQTLFDLMRQGAKFSCAGVLTKYMVRQLLQRCQGVGRKRSQGE
jgi:hypothetical protein